MLFVFLGLLFFTSCEKETFPHQLKNQELHSTIETRAKGYVAKACTTDDDPRQAGVACVRGSQGSCQNSQGCTAIGSLGADDYFSVEELSNWHEVNYEDNYDFMLHMYEIDWFIHPDDL